MSTQAFPRMLSLGELTASISSAIFQTVWVCKYEAPQSEQERSQGSGGNSKEHKNAAQNTVHDGSHLDSTGSAGGELRPGGIPNTSSSADRAARGAGDREYGSLNTQASPWTQTRISSSPHLTPATHSVRTSLAETCGAAFSTVRARRCTSG